MKTEMINLNDITAAPFQPRKLFNKEKMQELADSMKEQGLIQAITVRPLGKGYQLIAGERRVRAAKTIGWTEIRAEICQMDDMEAEEKSVVENYQRGDLEGEELEDIVHSLWVKGNGTRYSDRSVLAKRLGMSRWTLDSHIEAKESREGLGLKSQDMGKSKLTTSDFSETKRVDNEADRKKLLEKKANGQIGGREIREYADAVKDSPVAVKDAVLDKPKMFTPAIAKELSKLPDTVQLGAIATIKKGKMDEESAMEFVNEVHYATPDVQKAMMEDPKHITSVVAKELSKLKTPAEQQSTIKAIKEYRLDEKEAIEATKMMSGEIPGIVVNPGRIPIPDVTIDNTTDMRRLLLEEKFGIDHNNKLSKKSKMRIGLGLQNVVALMDIIKGIHSAGCSCPHCGKPAKEYLRWKCCDDGKNETLDEAFEYAKKQHAKIVEEETGKKVTWT